MRCRANIRAAGLEKSPVAAFLARFTGGRFGLGMLLIYPTLADS
jgi:hypothetical protein